MELTVMESDAMIYRTASSGCRTFHLFSFDFLPSPCSKNVCCGAQTSRFRFTVPDGVGEVVPAQVDGSGAVLDGLVERQWAGAGQVEPGLLCVAVQRCNKHRWWDRWCVSREGARGGSGV